MDGPGRLHIGVVGLVISVVTLARVQSVHRAQSEERALLRRLYAVQSTTDPVEERAPRRGHHARPAARSRCPHGE